MRRELNFIHICAFTRKLLHGGGVLFNFLVIEKMWRELNYVSFVYPLESFFTGRLFFSLGNREENTQRIKCGTFLFMLELSRLIVCNLQFVLLLLRLHVNPQFIPHVLLRECIVHTAKATDPATYISPSPPYQISMVVRACFYHLVRAS